MRSWWVLHRRFRGQANLQLALSVQFFGFGFAGLLRRFVIFPVEALWPKILPTLALNRALIMPEKKGEVLNGWKVGRYRYFLYCFGGMFLYFWIPNTLFTGLRVGLTFVSSLFKIEADDSS